MQTLYNTQQQTLNCTSFKILGIVFDHSSIVSVRVAANLQGALIPATLLFTFSVFNDLLRFGGATSEKLQVAISDKLCSQELPPYTIDISHEPLVFTNCMLTLCAVQNQEDTCYIVEDLTPLSILQQAKYLKENIKYFNASTLQKNELLNKSLADIAQQYKYYTGLLELDITEISARKQAGLLNDTLFKIAYYASR